jgi:hypothetical protein
VRNSVISITNRGKTRFAEKAAHRQNDVRDFTDRVWEKAHSNQQPAAPAEIARDRTFLGTRFVAIVYTPIPEQRWIKARFVHFKEW